MTVALADVVGVLDRHYDPAWAASWDAVGLVTGDPDQPVRRVLLAVDPVQAIIDEAIAWEADLLVTHHPLLLRGVHGVAATGPKGRAVTALVRAGVALHVAHTSADVADPGVKPLLREVMSEQRVGDLRPLQVDPSSADGRRGLGRVGRLDVPTTLASFVDVVTVALPPTPAGIRVAGDPDRRVETVAVCGGAGDDLFDEVRAAGVDVFVTADLRHHPASEALEHGTPALVDCSHWASEWPWLADARRLLLAGLGAQADTVETRVSTLVTDPWTTHQRSQS